MAEIDYEDPQIFEDEVRRISRILWPSAEFSGATIKAGKERDGVFETEECVHLVEATASKKKAKAEEDIIKLISLYKQKSKRSSQKPIQCWFITRVEPTADQRLVVDNYDRKEKLKINCLSFSQFQSKLINARHYISARDNYWFGSVHDPLDHSNNPNIKYVPLDLIDERNNTWKIKEMSDKIENRGRLVLLGDYGAGKSMTLREVYRLLKEKYLKGQSVKFPIYINLRDHQGQQYPDEILDRHARKIGFAPKDHLVRAWRAGYAHIILDGFDEITTFGITGKWKKLSEARYRSMEAIRNFVRDTPKDTGLIIAGRSYFFDNKKECNKSLCNNQPFETLSLNDFTEDQINQYLEINKIAGIVPNWMPSRPLLIGTLLLKGILQGSLNNVCETEGYRCDPGYGWDMLLNEIAYREAQIDPRLDPDTLRTIFDRLATKSRESIDGLASLSQEEIIDVFIDVCQYQPDDQAMVLLQRLPGLGIGSDVEGTRKFIDEDFADACRAGDFVRFIKDPFNCDFNKFSQIECSLANTGLKVSTHKLVSQDISEKQYNAAVSFLSKKDGFDFLKNDCVLVAVDMNFSIEKPISIYTILVDYFDCEEIPDLSKIKYHDSYFIHFNLPKEININLLPSFSDCLFSEMDGPVSEIDISGYKFVNCEIISYISSIETTSSILELDISTAMKVLLTILKKIYWQRGSGRLEGALYRGLDSNSKRYVDDILRILSSNGLTACYQRKGAKIWIPIRNQFARVSKIIAAPSSIKDHVVEEIKRLQ